MDVATRSRSELVSGDLKPLEVLVLERSEGLRTFLKVVLALHLEDRVGHVNEAADADEALELCRYARPAVVVMDSCVGAIEARVAAALLRATVPDVRIIAYADQEQPKPRWADAFLVRGDLYAISPLLDVIQR